MVFSYAKDCGGFLRYALCHKVCILMIDPLLIIHVNTASSLMLEEFPVDFWNENAKILNESGFLKALICQRGEL